MRSAYLVMVEPDENHNKYYQMTQKTTDIFEVRYGRVGAKGITRKYPISRWASIYESKLQKGYIDNSHLYSPTINTRYKEIPDKAVRSFWQDIENYSKKMLESNYSVSYDKGNGYPFRYMHYLSYTDKIAHPFFYYEHEKLSQTYLLILLPCFSLFAAGDVGLSLKIYQVLKMQE